jgi:hypothetical protein
MTISSPAPIPAPLPPVTPLVETFAPAPVPVPPPTVQLPEVFQPTPQPAPPPEPDYPELNTRPEAPPEPQLILARGSIPYAVEVLDEGDLVTPKVTQMNFIGASITASANGSQVSIQVSPETVATISAGTGIQVVPTLVSNGTNYQIINTFTEVVADLGSISGTFTPNRANGTIQKLTLTGNITLNMPTNMSAGQSLTLIMTQDATGGRVMTPNNAYKFASGFRDLSTEPTAIDMLNIFTDGTLYYTTLTIGYTT